MIYCRQLIIDSFSQCGTQPCIEFIIKHIRTNLDTPQSMNSHMKQLLAGLTWVRNPTETILGSFWVRLYIYTSGPSFFPLPYGARYALGP
jgi:hypothetical protein